jgi:hypothetical protein
MRRVLAWSIGWLFAAALYVLLIDITSLPELYVGAGAAALAATAFELARERDTTGGLTARLRWLGRLHKPLLRVPSDVAIVCALALRQLVAPRKVNGVFRAVPFRCDEDPEHETGRRALAEWLGSFAPNTIIIGVDAERELILGHQLQVSGDEEAIDVMGLGEK